MTVDVLAFSGTGRTGSLSQALLIAATAELQLLGATVREIDLRSFNIPIYDGDQEMAQGLPRGAYELRELVKGYDTLLISSTDYNGGVVPLLKNALDWVSRPHKDEANLSAIERKTVALISCALGMYGGSRAQNHLRQTFQVMRCIVIPDTVCIPFADKAFDANGTLTSQVSKDMLKMAMRELVRVSAAFAAAKSRATT
ncbi:MAG: NADPH-dependent FMN reductase [Alphaproteobacteria bacterium]